MGPGQKWVQGEPVLSPDDRIFLCFEATTLLVYQSVLELFCESVQVRAGRMPVSSVEVQSSKGLMIVILEQVFTLLKCR